MILMVCNDLKWRLNFEAEGLGHLETKNLKKGIESVLATSTVSKANEL